MFPVVTLFSRETGPLIQFDGKFLYTEDLNPETKIRWRMSRWELFTLSLKMIRVSLVGK